LTQTIFNNIYLYIKILLLSSVPIGGEMRYGLIVVFFVIICNLLSQTPDWLWATNEGFPNANRKGKTVVDINDNQYIIGYFQDTIQFGSISLTSSGGYDVFIAKMDSLGSWIWAQRAGGTSNDFGGNIAIDSLGNIYIVGSYQNSSSFGTIYLFTDIGSETFVAKLDSDGNWIYAHRITSKQTSNSISHINDLCIDTTGMLYVTGGFEGSVAFGTIVKSSTSALYDDIIVAKLDQNGIFSWAVSAGGSSSDSGYSIAADDSSNIFVSGTFNSSASFGATTLTSYGSYDVFVARLSSDGTWLWAVNAGSINEDRIDMLTIDSASNIYLTGFFQSSASFGSISLISNGSWDIYAAKIDMNGNWQWAVNAGGSHNDYSRTISVDDNMNVYISGYFVYIASFGTISLSSGNAETDIFVAKIDAGGNWSWALQAGGSDSDTGLSVVIGSSNSIYLHGHIEGTAFFGEHELSVNANNSGMFLAKVGYSLPQIQLLTDTHEYFYSVPINDFSEYRNVIIQNTGSQDLVVNSVSLALIQSRFQYIFENLGYAINPGEVDTIFVRFAPITVGDVNDTLFIESNAINMPVIPIRLYGTGIYVPPKLPENLIITQNGFDMFLTWDAVTEDIHDNPITPDGYIVLYSEDDIGYWFHGVTTNTFYTHYRVAEFRDNMFYHVIAYKTYRREQADFILGLANRKDKVSQEIVFRGLN
jgi:hypothetical protein